MNLCIDEDTKSSFYKNNYAMYVTSTTLCKILQELHDVINLPDFPLNYGVRA